MTDTIENHETSVAETLAIKAGNGGPASSHIKVDIPDASVIDLLRREEERMSITMINYTRKDRVTKAHSLLRMHIPRTPLPEKEAESSDGEYPPSMALGIPRLPILPTPGTQIDNIEYDPWGRRNCSTAKASILVALCIFAPPFWLLLGAGYFDRITGVVPRPAKLVSFCLGLTAMVVATIVAVVLAST